MRNKMEDKEFYRYDGNSNSIYSKIQKYIDEKYILKMNTVEQECFITDKRNKKTQRLNINSLCVELADAKLRISLTDLRMYLNSNRVEQFNPILKYLKKLPEWDGVDYIKKLCSFVPTTEPEEFNNQMEKWFVRTILCALEEDKINKHCIVLFNTIQSSGKTTFLRFLNPPALNEYYTEGMETNKDGRIKLAKNLIINLDELSALGKSNINSLKSIMSTVAINDRLPYTSKQVRINRICSFVGSTNMTEFLTDNTGNVRWIVFEVKGKIDFKFKDKIDINKVWAQAYHIAYNSPNYKAELSIEELNKNETRNEKYRAMTIEEEVINKYFIKSSNREDFMTASEIMFYLEKIDSKLNFKLNINRVGRAVTGLKFEKIKDAKRQVYGYLIKPVNIN